MPLNIPSGPDDVPLENKAVDKKTDGVRHDVSEQAKKLLDPVGRAWEALTPREQAVINTILRVKELPKVMEVLQPLMDRTITFDEFAKMPPKGEGLFALEHYSEVRSHFQNVDQLRKTILLLCDQDINFLSYYSHSPFEGSLQNDDQVEFSIHWYLIVKLLASLSNVHEEKQIAYRQEQQELLDDALAYVLGNLLEKEHAALEEHPEVQIKNRLIDLAQQSQGLRPFIGNILQSLETFIDRKNDIQDEVYNLLETKEKEKNERKMLEASLLIQSAIHPMSGPERKLWDSPLEQILSAAEAKQILQVYRSGSLTLAASDGDLTPNANFLLDLLQSAAERDYREIIFTEADRFLAEEWITESEEGTLRLLRALESFVNDGADIALLSTYTNISPETLRNTPPGILAYWRSLSEIVRTNRGKALHMTLLHYADDQTSIPLGKKGFPKSVVIGKWPEQSKELSLDAFCVSHRKGRDKMPRSFRGLAFIEHGVSNLVNHGQAGTGPHQTVGVPVGNGSRFDELFQSGEALEMYNFLNDLDLRSGCLADQKTSMAIVTVESESDANAERSPVEVDTDAPSPLDLVHQ